MKKKRVSVQLEEKLLNELDLICFLERKSRAQLIREIISNFVGCLNK
jgi:metal-responsive CopG/Arc/MetJ family transcriptional regulator